MKNDRMSNSGLRRNGSILIPIWKQLFPFSKGSAGIGEARWGAPRLAHECLQRKGVLVGRLLKLFFRPLRPSAPTPGGAAR